jgi:RNA polymerase sigma factor (sigma-70 family)
MTTAPLGTLLRHIEKEAGRCARQPTDRELLEEFAGRGSEAAFAALVSRHGPMVLRAARRVLRHEQDAEDAFQATFLVLARGARAIRKGEAVASWLHGVAYRTAMKAKRSAARRRDHEARRRAAAPPAAPGPTWDEVQAVLDEEVQRLPPCFREAFVLCVLEGKSGAEVAAELGCKEGTVKSRVNRARRALQRQLERRGIKLTALLAALAVAESACRAALPATLARATIRFGPLVAAGEPAAGAIPSHVAALAAGVTRAMFLMKARVATAVLLAAGVMAGAALWAQQALPPKNADKAPAHASPPGRGSAPGAAGKKAGETFTYKGRVLGPDGKPFAGAKLYLVLPGGSQKAPAVRATTGRDGRFEFTAARAELLPAGAPADVDVFAFLQVVAVAEGCGPDWTVPEKRPAGELTLRLPRNGQTFNGRALDLQGKPLAGAKVHVLRLETTPDDDLADFLKAWKAQRNGHLALSRLTKVLQEPSVAGLPKVVTADPEGRFRLPGAGGERIVVVSVEAPQVEHATLRLLPRPAAEVKALVRPPSEAMLRRGDLAPPTAYGFSFDHLALPARVVRGVVRDKETGKPLKGARVWGTAVGALDTRVETYTDADGRYQLRGLPKAGKYRITAWPGDFSGYIPGGREISAGDGTAAAEADFELYRGVEVRGRVTDKVTGKPVAAGVRYLPLDGNRHPAASLFRVVSKGCDGPGVGTFRERVPPGPGVFLVTVRPAGGDNRYSQVRLDPAEQTRTGLNEFLLHGVNAYRVVEVPADAKSVTCDIQVDPGLSVTGTVLGPDGKPLTGALAKGLTAVWPRPTALKAATFTAVALGPREPRQLLFVHRERKLAGHLVVRSDEKGDVTVRLAPWGALTGRVLDADGQPLAGVRIQLSFLHPTFFQPVTWWVEPQGEEVRTDRDGRFRAEGLTPGLKFRLSAAGDNTFLRLAGTPDGMRALSVGAGQTKDLGDLTARPD